MNLGPETKAVGLEWIEAESCRCHEPAHPAWR